MTQFGGSLRFVQLPAVTQLLAELGSTGRLCVSHAEWTGEIFMRVGQIADARLGAEHGRAALEAIALALPDGEFSFVDEPVPAAEHASPALVPADERRAYLDGLGAERQRIARLIPSLTLVPRLVEAPADTQITIGAAALQLIPALVLGHSLATVAKRRGLARTLRDLAVLIEGGLVTLDPPSSPAVDEPLLEKPTPLRVMPFSARPTAHRPAPRPRLDALIGLPPRPVSAPPRPAMPPAVAARLATASQFIAEPEPTPGRQPAATPGWHKAIVGFFLQPATD